MSALTDAIEAICRQVSGDPSADAVASELGDVVERQENALQVRPRDEHFDGAFIVHEDDGTLSHVELTLSEPAPLEELVAAFGEYREAPRLQPRRPRQLVFAVPGGAVIAVADRSDSVSGVTVRRDA